MYLWIEKYKNIEKEGFSFSPRFQCDFDGETLTIESKEHITIFPNNINVTAVVGKNGSGKSSILEAITFIANKYTLLKKKVVLVFSDENSVSYISNVDIKILSSLDITRDYTILTDKILFECDAYNNCNNQHLKRFFERLSDIRNFIYQLVEVFYYFDKLKIFNQNEKFKFDRFLFEISPIKIDDEKFLDNKNLRKDINTLLSKKFHYKKGFIPRILFNNIEEMLDYNLLMFYIKYIANLLLDDDSKITILNTFLNEIKLYNNTIFSYNFEKFLKENVNHYIKEIAKKREVDIEYLQFIKDIVREYKLSFDFLKENSRYFIQENNYFYMQIPLKKVNFIKKVIQRTSALTGIKNPDDYFYAVDGFRYDFVNKNTKVKYYDLSSGERNILDEIIKVLFYYMERDVNIVLLDEPDNHLHPDWKREFLSILFDVTQELSDKFHFIITTHSPFILSDIPKENIIFLEDGKNVSDEVVVDTFGANIHTLLSHGFFMRDGLMGEFAKEKINEVIRFLNDDDSSKIDKKEAKKIIEMIGEPLIKNQLQKMWDSKRLEKMDKIDELEEEIRLLKNRVEIQRENS